jgi:predicted aspartyl protease
MSIIRLPLRFEGTKGEKTLYALLDSGANLSCIHEEHAAEIARLCPLRYMRNIKLSGKENCWSASVILADFYVNNIQLSDEFFVLPQLTEEVIIGAATLRKWRIKLDFEHDTVYVDPKAAKLQLI